MHQDLSELQVLNDRITQAQVSAQILEEMVVAKQQELLVIIAKLASYRCDLMLRSYSILPIPSSNEDPASTQRPDIDLEFDDTYAIEHVTDHNGPRNKRRFLIKWEDYLDKESTWEPRSGLPNYLVGEYESQLPKKARKRRKKG